MPLTHFSVEVAIVKAGDNFGPMEGPEPTRYYDTNSVIDFAEYLAIAINHFKSRIRFENDIERIAMLVRTYQDHHTVAIDRANGDVRVRTNQ